MTQNKTGAMIMRRGATKAFFDSDIVFDQTVIVNIAECSKGPRVLGIRVTEEENGRIRDSSACAMPLKEARRLRDFFNSIDLDDPSDNDEEAEKILKDMGLS